MADNVGNTVDTDDTEGISGKYTAGTGKQVTMNGVVYRVPVDFDESIFQGELDIEEQLVEGLKGEVTAAQEGIQEIGKQEEAAVKGLRRGAATALATQRGLIEGGKGLSMARGTAAQAADKEAEFRAGFAKQMSAAKQKAAAAKTQALAEEGKLLSAKKARAGETAAAHADVKAIVTQHEGTVYTSDFDWRQMEDAFNAKANSATNPAVAAIYRTAAQGAKNQTLDSGSLFG